VSWKFVVHAILVRSIRLIRSSRLSYGYGLPRAAIANVVRDCAMQAGTM
jgi:hypothetical protein